MVMQEPEADENINIGLMKELTGNDKIIATVVYTKNLLNLFQTSIQINDPLMMAPKIMICLITIN